MNAPIRATSSRSPDGQAGRVLVTRPAGQAGEWVQRLHDEGIDAAALPLIGIAAMPDVQPLQAAWSTLARHRLVMFVSPNAAEHFFAARPTGLRWPADVIAASPGPGTTRALLALGVPAAQIAAPAADAPQFDSEALWARLRSTDWRGAQTLFVRGETGRDWLADRLREAGAEVADIAAYRRGPPVWDAGQERLCADAVAAPQRHLWWFSSSEAIDRLADKVIAPWPLAHALVTHPRIAARARQLGFGEVLEARAGADDVLSAIRRSLQSRPL